MSSLQSWNNTVRKLGNSHVREDESRDRHLLDHSRLALLVLQPDPEVGQHHVPQGVTFGQDGAGLHLPGQAAM